MQARILEKIDAVIENLAKRKAAKPRTLKTFRSTIKSLFVNQLSDEELDGLRRPTDQDGRQKKVY